MKRKTLVFLALASRRSKVLLIFPSIDFKELVRLLSSCFVLILKPLFRFFSILCADCKAAFSTLCKPLITFSLKPNSTIKLSTVNLLIHISPLKFHIQKREKLPNNIDNLSPCYRFDRTYLIHPTNSLSNQIIITIFTDNLTITW